MHAYDIPSIKYVHFTLGKLLSALLSGLSDRSATVRKSYAKTIGHLVKVSEDETLYDDDEGI